MKGREGVKEEFGEKKGKEREGRDWEGRRERNLREGEESKRGKG